MFKIFSKLFVALFFSLVVISYQAKKKSKDEKPSFSCNSTSCEYVPPSNVEFPLGDEQLTKVEYPPVVDVPPKCPTDCDKKEDFPDAHIPCVEFEQPLDEIHSCFNEKIIPENKCRLCNINLPPDNEAGGVLIKCYNCTATSSSCTCGAQMVPEITIYAAYLSIPSYKNTTLPLTKKSKK